MVARLAGLCKTLGQIMYPFKRKALIGGFKRLTSGTCLHKSSWMLFTKKDNANVTDDYVALIERSINRDLD